MTSGDHLLSPRGVRKKNRVHGHSGPVVAVRPEVRVGVERLRCAGMAEPRLHRLDALSMPDQQGGVEMSQRVEAGPVRRAGPLDGVAPNLAEAGTPDRRPGRAREHEAIGRERPEVQRDYRIGSALKTISDEHQGVTLLTNHHDRKAQADDLVDSVSGSHGLAGAADALIVIARPRSERAGVLKLTGRDIPGPSTRSSSTAPTERSMAPTSARPPA